MSDRDDCDCGFQAFRAAFAHQPRCAYRTRIQDGDNYMTESAKEPIPDDADFEDLKVTPDDSLGGIDTPSPHKPNTIPDSTSQVGVDLASGEDVTVVEKFVRIDPDSKWVLMLPEDTSHEVAELIAERIQKWWDQVEGYDFPILVVGGVSGLRLVRVDEHEIGPELVDCGAEYCPGHLVGGGEKCLTSHDLYQAE